MNEQEFRVEMNNLFERWEEKYVEPQFSHDGISNWEKWENQKLKILFLLKEAYDDFEPIFEHQEIRGNFGLNIARWNYVLKEYFNNPAEMISYPDNDDLKGEIDDLGIALVEVKKIDEGKKTSNQSEIDKYAESDKFFLKEQIELINPHVIVCCGTHTSYQIIFDWEAQNAISGENYFEDNESNLSCSYWIHNNRLIIYFYHPTTIGRSSERLFYLLFKMIREGKAFEKIKITCP
jgi:hypothetical protein